MLVVAMTGCLLWSQSAQVAPPKMVPLVETAIVKIGTVVEEITAVGSLRSEESVMIRTEIDGRILTLHFIEGQTVGVGEPLITLDAAEYEAQLAESQAAVKLNEINFERAQELYNKNLGSRQAFDEAKTKLEESRAHQALDKVRLEKTVIRAPFKGTVGLRNISHGAYVKAGDDLVTFGDSSSVKLDFRVPEKFLPRVKVGQEVNMRVDAYPNKTFTGKLYTTDTAIDVETRTLLLRARIPNPNIELLSGMFARVSLTLEQRKNAILIPEQAIVPQDNDSFVFKIIEGKAVKTKVTLGQRQTGDVEVLQGLKPQDRVVTAGQMKLRDGMEVSEMKPTPAN
ncbi:MAG: hypothetical protein BWK79_14395 [Beggiatoa sp. IS2]|nr:MAG: hypothetical protein BWK79_14395 [Beggiatoa sp. IS2]